MEPTGTFQFRQDIFCSSDRIVIIVVIGAYVKNLLSVHLNLFAGSIILAIAAVASISTSRSSRQISAMAVRVGQAKSLYSLQKSFSTSVVLQ